MRRRRKPQSEEGQSSLDAFTSTPIKAEETPAKVQGMIDLDTLERAEKAMEESSPQQEVEPVAAPLEPSPVSADQEPQTMDTNEVTPNPLRTFNMPSLQSRQTPTPVASEVVYHDLGLLYPNPPIETEQSGIVIHRAILNDLGGTSQLMDWLAEGHAAIVNMDRLMKKELEFTTALNALHTFIEGDLGGQIIQVTDTRLMLLPPGCRGLKGLEMEAFAVDSREFSRTGL